jgi:hypothetical protein
VARIGVVTAVVTIVAALTGCGSEPGSSAATSSGTPETWTQRANSVCKASREEVESLGSPEDPEALADVYEETNRGFREFIAEMRRLDVPAPTRTSYLEMIDMYERAMHVQERVPSALRTGDFDQVIALGDEVHRWGDRGDEIARRLELDECAKDPKG